MSILNKYKHWNFNLKLNKENYWDIVISKDRTPSTPSQQCLVTNNLSAYIDFGDKNCYEKNGVHSYPEYFWDKSKNSGILLEDIGYTGIDNGLIYYGGWDKVSNKEFFNIFTNSKLEIESGDTTLHLHSVTGNTGIYDYDYTVNEDYVSLMGGFYQGFFKLHGNDYQVLPNYIENEWNLEFKIRPRFYVIGDNALNNIYPNNSGIFFYIGTRAENKFIQLYNCDLSKYPERQQPERHLCDKFHEGYFENEGTDEVLESNAEKNKNFNKMKAEMLYHFLYEYGFKNYEKNSCDCISMKPKEIDDCINFKDSYFSDEYKSNKYESNYLGEDDYTEKDIIISGETLYTKKGELLSDSGYYEIKTDNKFLFFNRTKYGFTTANWDDDIEIILTGSTENEHNDNLYLLMNRGKSGYTVNTIDNYYSNNKEEFNFIPDIQNNAFALKYNSDGSITYRYLIKDCEKEEKYTILEETTWSGLVTEDVWNTINVKFKLLGNNEFCSTKSKNKMKIFIYINGYLRFISKELPEFNFHELKGSKEKQEGVPYNISIGGGTQGLCDSQWLDYEHAFQKVLPIEKNFAGSFIGDIKSFKFYTNLLEYEEIKTNCCINN